jgi:hypothetical protein
MLEYEWAVGHGCLGPGPRVQEARQAGARDIIEQQNSKSANNRIANQLRLILFFLQPLL